MQEISVSSYFLRAVVKNATEKGLDVPRLLRRAHNPQRLFREINARVTADQYASLQAITMRELNDEALGYTQLPQKVGTWSAVCHWVIHVRTLSQALKRFCLFYSLMERGLKTELSTHEDTLTVHFSPWQEGEAIDPFAYELFMFGLHRLACWLTEDSLPIQQVRLNYPEPEHSQEYRAMFPGAESVFCNTENRPAGCALTFRRRVMELPVKQTPESLSRFLRQPLLNVMVNDYNQQSWSAKTRAILRRRLSSIPTLVEVAAELDIHPKKLRRKLEAEGISYGDLKSQLRRDIAIRHLTKSSEAIEQIAYLTGFSETCTFTRAFKRWTGVTPFTYRKRAKSGAG
ncbi:AraC family transcriptional regulator [Pseudomaricurvus sp.]|uniref:AraC family transcriptional regulator n=1 Tax=Pseudomaricurvus sp. TaxID=2004510 RepID=UPI003F6C37B8